MLIIVGEDNPIEMEFIEFIITKNKEYTLQKFSDGQSLYNYIKTSKITPSIVFLDINMPIINGIDLLYMIREESIYCPIIMLSTSIEPKDINKSYLYGTNSYLVKPVDFSKFEELIDKTLYYWLNLNKPCYDR